MEIRDNEHLKKVAINFQNVDFYCGWCAGCVETCILFPLNKMTFRQQLYGLVLKDAITQIHKEGIPFLYRGLLPPLIQRTTTRMVMFGMFDTYKRILGCHSNNTFNYCFVSSAFLAGATESLLCPLERLQILLQTSAYHTTFKNTREAFKYIKSYSFLELYRGFTLITIRNSLSNVLFFTLRDPLKDFILNKLNNKSSIMPSKFSLDNLSLQCDDSNNKKVSLFLIITSNFASGALLGAGISTFFFPLNVIKHRMQSMIGSDFKSAHEIFLLVLKERNNSIKGLFRGVHLNYTRSLLTWGITNTVYELMKLFFQTIQ